MRENESLITVAEYENDFDAEIAKLALESAGLKVAVVGGDLIANMPPIQEVRIQLQVLAGDFEKAKSILAEMDRQPPVDVDGLFDSEPGEPT